MASAAVTKYKEQVAQMKRSASARRNAAKSHNVEDYAVQMASGFVLGKLDQEVQIPTVIGLDGLFVGGGVAAVIATTTRGTVGRWLTSASKATLAISSYRAGKTFDAG